jgi:hypothetical protein
LREYVSYVNKIAKTSALHKADKEIEFFWIVIQIYLLFSPKYRKAFYIRE